eukprot:6921387-Prorocentrum_lima.AAC.1
MVVKRYYVFQHETRRVFAVSFRICVFHILGQCPNPRDASQIFSFFGPNDQTTELVTKLLGNTPRTTRSVLDLNVFILGSPNFR